MMNPLMTGAACAALAIASSAHAQFLYVAESGQDRVVALNAFDGSVVNANFLDIAAAAASVGYTGTITPIEAMDVGNEIWVTDQNADRVWRFNQDGTFAGQYGVDPTNGQGLLNNVRGFEVVGNTAYFAQGSDATDVGGQAEGIVTMDTTTGTITGSFIGVDPDDASYWDVKNVNGQLYVTNSDSGNDGIFDYSVDGTFNGAFALSEPVSNPTTNFDFAQQINLRDSNGNLIVGGFSPPSGVYEFLQDGTELGVLAGTENLGPRAAYELGNGNVLFSHGIVLNRTGDDPVFEGSGLSFRFINAGSVPAPGALVAFGVLGVFSRRRRA